jgi:uncharacterized sporulation protein YeaH/YhbH (DUF444 family)
MKVITPIKQDFRYRQYREIKIPASNAVIFFARDCSGSMDDYKCDIVSDMAWWIDRWIKRFYKRVDHCYYVHDTRAQEVNEQEFYTYRYGGGTQCSSAFESISQQFENRYPPQKFNIYVFYFTDGDNWDNDNEKVVKIIQEKFPQGVVNFVGITQICSYSNENSVKEFIDKKINSNELDAEHIRTAEVGSNLRNGKMSEDDRNSQILDAIKKLLSVEA